MENRLVRNRKSPANEDDYIKAYKDINKNASKSDGLDISAVKTKDGTCGHALLKQEINRGKATGLHHGKDFIPDSELRKRMK